MVILCRKAKRCQKGGRAEKVFVLLKLIAFDDRSEVRSEDVECKDELKSIAIDSPNQSGFYVRCFPF